MNIYLPLFATIFVLFCLPFTFAEASAGGLSTAADSKQRLINKLRARRPHTMVTHAQQAINRMASANGAALLARVKATDMTCSSCLQYVGIIQTIAGNDKMLNASKVALIDACNAANGKGTAKAEECIIAVEVVTFALPILFKALEGIEWDIPFNLCAILFDNICTQNCCLTDDAPEQVYISLTDSNDFSKMRVTWVTLKASDDSDVLYYETAKGISAQRRALAEPTRTYTLAGWIGTINTAVMVGLEPNTTYTYTVGSNATGRSEAFSFTTFPTNIGTPERPLRILNVADMSYDNFSDTTAVRMFERGVGGKQVDLIIHNGDISYADGYMRHWDMFMRKVGRVVARIPYMTTPGNHEIFGNFTSYRARLAKSMPKEANTLEGAMYYSLNIGPVRILMMDSESFIDTPDLPATELDWANTQLASQDRAAQPWSLVFHHRPLYCNLQEWDCKEFAAILRLQAESTYLRYKVDMVNTGHVHYYLRSYPIALGAAVSTSYDNPTAPVYVVNGAAGNREGTDNAASGGEKELYPVGFSKVGYGLMEVVADVRSNKHWVKYSFFESATDKLLDTFTITKSTA